MLRIEVIAPSSSPKSLDLVYQSVEFMSAHGFIVNFDESIFDTSYKYHSNSAEYRLQHLLSSLHNDDVDIIWPVMGGFGASEIANHVIDSEIDIKKPKILCGFSDITALHTTLHEKLLCIHSPVFRQMHKYSSINDYSLMQTIDCLKHKTWKIEDLAPILHNSQDSISGKVMGGNLCVLCTSFGTRWQPDLSNSILLLEDINENAARIDRMLTHIKNTYSCNSISAVVFGTFDGVESEDLLQHTILRFAESVPCPVYRSRSFGHGESNLPFIIGKTGTITRQAEQFVLSNI